MRRKKQHGLCDGVLDVDFRGRRARWAGMGVRMGSRDACRVAFYSKSLFFRRESDEMESEKEDFSTPEFPTSRSAIPVPNAECPMPVCSFSFALWATRNSEGLHEMRMVLPARYSFVVCRGFRTMLDFARGGSASGTVSSSDGMHGRNGKSAMVMNGRRCLLALKCLLLAGWVAFVAGSVAGCASNFSRGSSGREQTVGPGRMTPSEIQSEVMSFTDSFNAAITQSWSGVSATGRAEAAEAGFLSPEGERATALRRAALEVNLSNATASLSIASSPNPFVALADMVTLVTLQRMVLETPQAAELYGPELQAKLVAVYRAQEGRIWRIAERAMTPEQQEELRELIASWREENPTATYVANVRLEDYGSQRQQGAKVRRQTNTGLLALFALDPMAGLDPVQREAARSRMLAERVFFFASRSGSLVKWNVELLYQNLLRAPEFNQLLESVKQASDSTARFSALAERVPAELTTQREEAIKQFFAALTKEREAAVNQAVNQAVSRMDEAISGQRRALLAELENAKGGVRDTLRDVRETAQATDKLAERLTTLVHAADVLAGRILPDAEAPDPNRMTVHEFNAAAERTGETVDRMTRLVERVEALLASPAASQGSGVVRTAVQEVQMGSNQVMDRAFWRLVVLALLVPFSVAAAYKWAVRRT